VKWTVAVTHPPTGEEMLLGVEAASRDDAAALARDRGFHVRDCYRAGRGFYKGARAVAWVWFGLFAFIAITALLCGFGGLLPTPGDSGVKEGLGFAGFTGLLAALGFFIARAMAAALRRGDAPDPRRGFEVVRTAGSKPGPAPPPLSSGEGE
jgi:hypothetical protein